ncbi:MAG: hypothetical protein WBI14_00995 [Anaerolineaceae bacterium]
MSRINPYEFRSPQASKRRTSKKPNLGRQLMVLGISMAAIIGSFGLIGWLMGGVEAAKGALTWGLILTLMASPSLVIVFIANPLSDFSGRWGAHLFKKHYEAEHVVPEEDETPTNLLAM